MHRMVELIVGLGTFATPAFLALPMRNAWCRLATEHKESGETLTGATAGFDRDRSRTPKNPKRQKTWSSAW